MNLLIVAATELEIAPFIKLNLPVDVLITGVGVPATMYHLQKKISTKKYQLVIQAGIAGSFTGKLALGEVVIVEKDCFADIGITEKGLFTSIFDTNLADKNLFPYQNGWLTNAILLKDKLPVKMVSAVTINMVSDSVTQKKMLKEKYNAQIESMEGAALHYVCLQQNVPFLQLRSISNMVGERDKSKWAMSDAIKNLNTTLVKFLMPKEK
jgi:futalosine hydrolase